MKNILHLASWYPNKNVPQEGDFIQRQLKALAEFMPVYVIAVFKDESLTGGTFNISHHSDGDLHETIGYYNTRRYGTRTLNSAASLYRYRRFYRQLIRDHIKKHGVPELIHLHVAFRASILLTWIEEEFSIPYVVSEHWSGYKAVDPGGFAKQPAYVRAIIKRTLSNARAVFAVSESLQADMQKIVPEIRYEVVPNVVDESKFFPPAIAEPLMDNPKLRFLHVSGMGPEKQPELLFRAFDEIRDRLNSELVCLGAPPAELENWVKANIQHSKDILFRGSIPYEEVALEMRRADCLVISSSYETFSCVAVEALNCGLPVISTPVGILPDIIRPENGMLTEAENLALSMLEFAERSKGYDRQLISDSVKGRFSFQTVGNKLIELYKNL
ncbi:MAG: glycosyltransferase [Flavitalea sp.]